MPELPEVEIVVRTLAPQLVGQQITAAKLFVTKMRRSITADLPKYLLGATILTVKRLAKYIILSLSNDYALIIHLGMTGRLFIINTAMDVTKHQCLLVQLINDTSLIFTDARKFGLIDIIAQPALTTYPYFQTLGLDPLDPQFDIQYLKIVLTKNPARPIKQLLMDNQAIVGIGNIYASEILFKANIHPLRIASSLTETEQQNLMMHIPIVLTAAIAAGGSSIKDFVDGTGHPGTFQKQFNVYGRKQQPCFICQVLIQKLTQAGRSSFFCPNCQLSLAI